MKKLIMLAMVIGLLSANVCYAQSAKETVRALQKLQARTEAGISYRDYGPAVGDAWFEVKLFLNSPEVKEKAELTKAINKTIEHYKKAGQIWNLIIELRLRGEVPRYLFNNGIMYHGQRRCEWSKVGCDYEDQQIRIFKPFVEDYPELLTKSRKDSYTDNGGLSTGEILGIIWGEAGRELEKAITLLR